MKLRIALLATVVALAGVACGDDDAADTTTTTEGGTTSLPATTTTAAGGDVSVNIVSFAFQPNQIEIELGHSVIFTVADGSHTVNSATDAWEPSGGIGEGSSFTVTPTAAGTYDFFCNFHSQMTGTITVTG
jgi:plastocyanin